MSSPLSDVLPRASKLALCLGFAVLCSACQAPQDGSGFWAAVTPYKVEVVQGNVITKEQAALVKLGLSSSQVRDLLGQPLLRDAFHADRWDYVFTIRRSGAELKDSQVVLRFVADKLKSIETSELPGEREFVAAIDNVKPKASPPLSLTPEQLAALPKPSARSSAAASAPAVPARSYPPLGSARARCAFALMSAPGQPPMRVAIAGASGRMGRMLIEALQDEPGAVLSAALDRADSPSLGLDASAHTGRPSGIAITEGQGAGLAAALAASDVLIDFTRPEASMLHAQACAEAGVRLVIGTTGFSPQQRAELAAAATKVGMVQAPNMSVGVQVVMHLLRQAAQALSQGYDVEVIETHHRHKVDAPSGTALQMGEVLARALGRDLNECGVFARHGHTGERRANEIGFSTIRGGDVVGDHTVLFAGVGERIEISHKSSSRVTYAQGSFRAARFLMQSPPGLYTMADVLGLEPL